MTTRLQTTEHTMPINQIVEVEKADDESINIIKLVISDLAVSAKSDAAGALRLLDAGARNTRIHRNIQKRRNEHGDGRIFGKLRN